MKKVFIISLFLVALLALTVNATSNLILTDNIPIPSNLVHAGGEITIVKPWLFSVVNAPYVVNPGQTVSIFLRYEFRLISGNPTKARFAIEKCIDASCTSRSVVSSYFVSDMETALQFCTNYQQWCTHDSTASFTAPMTPGRYRLTFWVSNTANTQTFDSGIVYLSVGDFVPCSPVGSITACLDEWTEGVCGSDGFPDYSYCNPDGQSGEIKCVDGQGCVGCFESHVRTCQVSNGCSGTQTCHNNAWGSCENPSCGTTGGDNSGGGNSSFTTVQKLIENNKMMILFIGIILIFTGAGRVLLRKIFR